MITRTANLIFLMFPRAYATVLELMHRGSSEKKIFLRLIKPGWCVFDIGANRGHFSHLFCSLVRSRGLVHAFEPLPSTFEILERSLSRTELGRIKLNNCAVGDRVGEVDIFLPGSDDGQASLRTHHEGSWEACPTIMKFSVPMTDLDSYCSDNEIRKLDFIKIDIEGAELLAIKGAQDTLRQLKPLLFVEVCREWLAGFQTSPEEMIIMLSHLGYDQFVLATGGRLNDIDLGAVLDGGKIEGDDSSSNLICGQSTKHGLTIAKLGVL